MHASARLLKGEKCNRDANASEYAMTKLMDMECIDIWRRVFVFGCLNHGHGEAQLAAGGVGGRYQRVHRYFCAGSNSGARGGGLDCRWAWRPSARPGIFSGRFAGGRFVGMATEASFDLARSDVVTWIFAIKFSNQGRPNKVATQATRLHLHCMRNARYNVWVDGGQA